MRTDAGIATSHDAGEGATADAALARSDAGADAGPSGAHSRDASADAASDAGARDAAPADAGSPGACPMGAAGAPPDDYLAQFHSGTRLKPMLISADGMPDLFTGFFDTQLSFACDFATATDGELRCLPRSAVGGVAIFADDACKNAIVHASPACSAQTGYDRRPTECNDVFQVRRLVKLAADATQHTVPERTCTASSVAIAPSDTTFVDGDAADPSMFAHGSARELPGVCKAGLRVVDGEDGSLGPLEPFDVKSGAACQQGKVDGPASCKPMRLAFIDPTLFSDAACTTSLFAGDWPWPPSCRAPDFIDPGTTDDIYTVAGSYAGDAFTGNNGCMPARDQAWVGAIFTPGDKLTKATALPQFDGLREGSGRLRAYVLAENKKPLIATLGPGLLGPAPALYDATLGRDCDVLRFADGELRCVPVDEIGPVMHEFNDSGCTQPLQPCSGLDCAGQMIIGFELSSQTCGLAQVTQVLRFTVAATGYYRDDGGSGCAPAGAVPTDRWQVEAVDLSTLATVQSKTLD